MYQMKTKIATTVALSLAAALTLGGCNKKTDDIVRSSAPSSTGTSAGTSGGSDAMAPSSGASGTRPEAASIR